MEEVKKDLEQTNLLQEKHIKKSIRVQRTEYVRQQLKKRKEAEDALLVKLLEEQRVIDGLQEEIRENLEQTEESSKYNQELKESINAQIYALHGISKDKLEGMKEYRRAYYRGCACALFLLSASLVVLCGILHGFDSEICLAMLSCSGLEGALLVQEKRRIWIADVICRCLYLMVFPAMTVLFVCYELEYPEYELLLPYMVMADLVLLVFAAVSYFFYYPYRAEKRKARNAREHIEEIEKSARKEVRRNQKSLKRALRKQTRRLKKEERRKEKEQQKEHGCRSFLQSIKAGWLRKAVSELPEASAESEQEAEKTS